MQININREDLLKSLAKVQSIVEKRGVVEIFDHVKIDITSSAIYLTTTDSEIMITDSIPIKSNFTFSCTTISYMLYEIVRRMYDTEEITLMTEKDGEVIVKSNNSKFHLPSLPVDTFPNFDTKISGVEFNINAKSLAFLLNQTKQSIFLGEARYYLTGVYFHSLKASDIESDYDECEENEKPNYHPESVILRSVATDIHRLACAEIEFKDLSSSIKEDFGIIIPRKAVNIVTKLLEDVTKDTEIQVKANKNRIMFAIGETRVISKIIDAKFPNYKDVVKAQKSYNLLVDAYNLKKSIELVTAIADNRNKEVRFFIEPNKLTISINNTTLNKSSAKQEIAASFDSPKNMEILLNVKYIMDCLNAIAGDTVKFKIKDELSFLTVYDNNDYRCKYILMPMRLENEPK